MINRDAYKYINLEYIYDLADGDDEFAVEIIGTCIDTLGANMQKLMEAIDAVNKEAIIFLTHKLKGSLRFIGCNHEGALIEKIEHLAESTFTNSEIANIARIAADRLREIEKELIHFKDSIGD